ncbi:hypothetical protein [Halopiger thermotolerans]
MTNDADRKRDVVDAFDVRYESDGEGERLAAYRTGVVLFRATA